MNRWARVASLASLGAVALLACTGGASSLGTPGEGASSSSSSGRVVKVGPDDGSSSGEGPTNPTDPVGGDGGLEGGFTPPPPPEDPCPSLPIPATCNGRTVMYREWGPSAVGDGTYFADQAPWKLGFNRQQGWIWIVKFRTENNTYGGRISAYGDNTGGLAWISDKPCDASFAFAEKTIVWGGAGGGDIPFAVARNTADTQVLKTDPKFFNPSILKGDHCYYAVFQNTGEVPTKVDLDWVNTVPEACGNASGCFYLSFTFAHFLHLFDGTTVTAAVIPGLTIGL
jgi:hypothetical protein